MSKIIKPALGDSVAIIRLKKNSCLMQNLKHFITPLLFVGLAVTFQSCLDDDDDKAMYHPTALVTVEPADDESFIMHLDDNTILQPVNMAKSPYGKKEVRALVNFSETVAPENGGSFRKVYVNWLDSIRTKRPVPTTDIPKRCNPGGRRPGAPAPHRR